jgi:NAD-dependent dihydropyrimidine dehydrogenase PreA subunit
VDWSRCEGDGDCARVCPYNVFDVRVMDEEDAAGLPFWIMLRDASSENRARKVAYAARATDCRACGRCIAACPEAAVMFQTAS